MDNNLICPKCGGNHQIPIEDRIIKAAQVLTYSWIIYGLGSGKALEARMEYDKLLKEYKDSQ